MSGSPRESSQRESSHSGMPIETRVLSLPGAVASEMPVPVPLDALEDLEKHEEEEIAKAKLTDPFLVDWDGPSDPQNPLNWRSAYRWLIVAICGTALLIATFASTAPTGILADMQREFGISREVTNLTISLYLIGYMLGPIVWGPLSERIGRKKTMLIAVVPFTIVQLGCGFAKTAATMLVLRFLSGAFGSSNQAVNQAMACDCFGAKQRAVALAVFSLAPFAGPAIGPLVSGAVVVSGIDYHWVWWLTTLAGAGGTLMTLALPETYGPYLMKKKATRLRKETGDARYWLVWDLVASPIIMLCTDPMLLLTSIYFAFVYGCLYLLFPALPYIFIKGRGWNLLEEGIIFTPLPVGGVITCLLTVFYFNPRYRRVAAKLAPIAVPAEERLRPCVIAAPLYCAAYFILGWTSYPHLPYAGPVIALLMIGVTATLLMQGLATWTVDTYMLRAATALAAQTILRSATAAAFPLVTNLMYDALGVPWACSVLGFVALAMVPIPILFLKYGPVLRARYDVDYSK